MTTIHYAGHTIQSKPNETVLDCLLRNGLPINFSCKSGVCHRCMVKCVNGEIPEKASKKLPMTHRDQNYLLACQCIPTTDMQLVEKSNEDTITQCITSCFLMAADHTAELSCETYRELPYKTGEHVIINTLAKTHSIIGTLVSDPEMSTSLSILIQPQDIAWIKQENLHISGNEFYVKGPLPASTATAQNKKKPNPTLWEDLGGDQTIRAVITTFYKKVYADPQLSPFFERVTMDRIIGKQFAFLKDNITGEQVYFGELPKNTHHWMVISEQLFEHRMNLMHQALCEHAVSEELMTQLVAYELQFKQDIVKTQPWLKQIGNLLVDTEKYEECELDEATVCDYCEAEIKKHTVVRFHMRLGKVACPTCSQKT